MPVIISR